MNANETANKLQARVQAFTDAQLRDVLAMTQGKRDGDTFVIRVACLAEYERRGGEVVSMLRAG